jgi:hypothetical protein
MHILISDRALLRLLAGAVVLAGTSACSRPDRADTGTETNQPSVAAAPADTQATAVTTPDTGTEATSNDTAASPRTETTGADQDVPGYRPMAQDTIGNYAQTQTRPSDQTDTVAVGDSAHIGKPGERLEGSQASEQANQDTLEEQADTGRIRPPEDFSETTGAAVGSREMARDTSVELAQGDTTAPADTAVQPAAAHDTAVSVNVDTTATAQPTGTDTATVEAQVDTTATAQVPAADTSAIQVSVDTTTAHQQAEVAVENQPATDTAVADTAVAVGDSAAVDKPGERLEPEVATAEGNVDTLTTDAERVRPPEDSTEVLGNVTTDEAKAEAGEVESRDAAAVAAAGVPSTGNVVTGANAVAQMSRQGRSCAVATDPADIRWDLAGSPATLNPCGTGTMTLPRIVTAEE